MTRRLAPLALACACGGAVRAEWRFSDEVVAARDGGAMRKLVREAVTNGGLWFADKQCASEFGEPGQISGGRVDAFAACLATLGLHASARRDALPDVVVLDYAPGFEVEARVIDQRISWIGYSARLERDLLPSVSAAALEARRVAGDRDGPIADPGTKARAWLKVCADEAGNVTSVQPREITSTRGTEAFVAAAGQWRFKPFDVEGRAIAVCAMFHVTHPPEHPADEHERLPYPLTMMNDKPMVPEVELHRVEGEKLITPDDRDKTVIQRSRAQRIVGAYKICLDERGRPADVIVLRSTTVEQYDLKIVRTIKDTWRYSPFVIDGVPHSVCTAVTFIYSQR